MMMNFEGQLAISYPAEADTGGIMHYFNEIGTRR